MTRPALIALVIATAWGLGVVEAQTSRKASRPAAPAQDSILVRIGKETITTGVVQRRIEELPENVRPQFTTPEGRQRLLDRLVEERVWLQTARKKGVEDRPEVRRQIEQQRRDLLIRTYINELMATNPAPTDSQARAWYDSHSEDYKTPATVSVSHIQSASESEAKKIRQWLRNGQDWTKLATRYSADTLTRARGGTLGPTTRDGVFGHLGRQPAIAETAFTIGAGKIGGPIKSDRGWHVIKVDDLKPEGLRSFDQVRGAIIRQLGSRNSQEFYQAQLVVAKTDLGVKPDSAAIRKFLEQKKTAREMFAEAQLAGSPAERIEAYRRLVQEYPDSDVSPQGAFMVGFIQSEELKDYEAAEKSFRELLERYPKSELAASARWMLEHMRTETAPEFMNLEADSAATATKTGGTKGKSKTP